MSKDISCSNCGKVIKSVWQSCINCGQPREEAYFKCSECKNLIFDPDAIFCGFCTKKLTDDEFHGILKEKKRKEKMEGREIITEPSHIPIGKDLLIRTLQFDYDNLDKLSRNKEFSYLSHIIIQIATVFTLLTFLVQQLLFESPNILDSLRIYTLGYIGIITGVYLISYVISELTKLFEPATEHTKFVKLIGHFLLISLLKDVFSILAALYIFAFEGRNGGSLSIGIFGVLTAIVVVFLIIQFTIYLKNVMNISAITTIFLLAIAVGIAISITNYILIIADPIIDYIIGGVFV